MAAAHGGDPATRRAIRVARLLVLGSVLGLGLVGSIASIGRGADAAADEAAVRLSLGRALHTATVLDDGSVLIVGGVDHRNRAATRTLLFDPETERFSGIGEIAEPRVGHTAHRLPDGDVLVIGGFDPAAPASIERYDAEGRTFSTIGSLDRRFGFSASVLPDGRLLIAGGTGAPAAPDGPTASAVLLDPSTGALESTGSMSVPRAGHRATSLADGRVLIHGGDAGDRDEGLVAEIYDPEAGTFSAVPIPFIGHTQPPTAALDDGRVLIPDGVVGLVFDPTTDRFSEIGPLPQYRMGQAVVAVPGGDALVVAGGDSGDVFGRVDRWDAASGEFTIAGVLLHPRLLHTATLLDDGTILVVGGIDQDRVVPQAERFDPDSGRSVVLGVAPGGDSVARARQASPTVTGDAATQMPALVAGRELEVRVLDGHGWLALYDGDSDAEREARVAIDALAEAAGIDVSDMRLSVAIFDPRTGRTGVIASVAFPGVAAVDLLEPAVELLLGDVLVPAYEPTPVDGFELQRVTDAAMPGAYPRYAYTSGDAVWIIDADARVVPQVLRDLPPPDRSAP